MMPWSRSCRRISSARAKFLAFLAVVRSSHERVYGRIAQLLLVRGGLEDVENGVEALEKGQRGGGVASAELAGIHGAVSVAHVFEDSGQRFGGIEVVIEAVAERPVRGGGALD